MRLTLKLTLALTIIMVIQFTIYGYLVAQRLNGFFERDIKRDTLQIGRTLSTAVSRVWKTQGSEEALTLISEANEDHIDIQIRFVWLSEDSDPNLRPALPLTLLSPLEKGSFFVKHIKETDSEYDSVYTYIRVPLEGTKRGAIEMRQSYAPESQFTTISLIRIAAFLFIVIATTTLVMWFFGLALVARPIERLRKKARRIAKGDFSDHIEVKGKDEISLLANEINQMSDELYRTRKLLDEEMTARLTALEQLRHADRLTTIGTLASGVAHELGTPLTVATGHINLMPTILANPEELQSVRSALSEQLDKMAVIVRQLLNFSRRRAPEKSIVDLREVLDRVVRMLVPFGDKRNISIQYPSIVEPALAEVDAGQIEQVLTNLIVNAMQSMESGTITVNITSAEKQNPERPEEAAFLCRCISVQDSGSGMSKDEMKQIFDPFFTTKAPGQGTGMGLSISHGIIHEHGGWITVESSPGEGSLFSVYIPVGDHISC